MKKAMTLVMLGLVLMQCGCSQVLAHYAQKNLNMTEMHKTYIQQGRVFNPVVAEAAEGETIEITIKGVKKIALESELRQLSAIPKNKGAIEAMGDVFFKVGSVIAAAFAFDGLIGAVKDPTITETEVPVFVRP